MEEWLSWVELYLIIFSREEFIDLLSWKSFSFLHFLNEVEECKKCEHEENEEGTRNANSENDESECRTDAERATPSNRSALTQITFIHDFCAVRPDDSAETKALSKQEEDNHDEREDEDVQEREDRNTEQSYQSQHGACHDQSSTAVSLDEENRNEREEEHRCTLNVQVHLHGILRIRVRFVNTRWEEHQRV